jgi:hypothetical protein
MVILGETSAAYTPVAVMRAQAANVVRIRARNGMRSPCQSPVGYFMIKLEATGVTTSKIAEG